MSVNKIPTRRLGKAGPNVSTIGLGTMGMGAFYGQTDDKESMKTLDEAFKLGITFWDTSDVYGTSEKLIGEWFQKNIDKRDKIFLATKFGLRNDSGSGNSLHPNSKPSYIRHCFFKSLAALGTDHIDLYYQHRVDPTVPIEMVLQTLWPFIEEGKLGWIGLSEPSIETLRRAKAVPKVGEKVIAAQMEYSPFELEVEKSGFAKAAEECGVGIVAYSPLARGLVTGRFRSRADFEKDDFRLTVPRFSEENFPKNLEITEKLGATAKKYDATPSQITLAWILAEHKDFIPIPGVRSVERLKENARAVEVKLSVQDVKEIRKVVDSADVAGERYAELPKGDCIPLSEWKGEPEPSQW